MDDTKGFRKILFWVITSFFVIITILTILSLFFGIGNLKEEYKSKLLTAFILEIAAALVALFYNLFHLKNKDEDAASVQAVKPSGLLPAQNDISEKELKEIGEKQQSIYVSPDRSFTLKSPPADWIIKEDFKANIIAEMGGVKNQDFIHQLQNNYPGSEKGVVFRSPKKFTIIPKPGQTLVNQSLLLSAVPFTFYNQLFVFPESRFRPPIYTYAGMQSVLFEVLKKEPSISVSDIKKMNTYVLKDTNLKITEVEVVQSLQNAILNDNEYAAFEIHHHFFGIEGELKHYILQASYLKIFDAEQTAANDNSILIEIVNSFRPLRLLDAQASREKEREEAEKKQRLYFKQYGQQAFLIEFSQLLLQFSEEDIQSKEKIRELKKGLKQFRPFASQVDFTDQEVKNDLDKLWLAIDKSNEGDDEELKLTLQNILNSFNQSIEERFKANHSQ